MHVLTCIYHHVSLTPSASHAAVKKNATPDPIVQSFCPLPEQHPASFTPIISNRQISYRVSLHVNYYRVRALSTINLSLYTSTAWPPITALRSGFFASIATIQSPCSLRHSSELLDLSRCNGDIFLHDRFRRSFRQMYAKIGGGPKCEKKLKYLKDLLTFLPPQ